MTNFCLIMFITVIIMIISYSLGYIVDKKISLNKKKGLNL